MPARSLPVKRRGHDANVLNELRHYIVAEEQRSETALPARPHG